jgi:hypothetical protein
MAFKKKQKLWLQKARQPTILNMKLDTLSSKRGGDGAEPHTTVVSQILDHESRAYEPHY